MKHIKTSGFKIPSIMIDSWFFDDDDHDGVINGVDCEPYNKKKQDAMTPANMANQVNRALMTGGTSAVQNIRQPMLNTVPQIRPSPVVNNSNAQINALRNNIGVNRLVPSENSTGHPVPNAYYQGKGISVNPFAPNQYRLQATGTVIRPDSNDKNVYAVYKDPLTGALYAGHVVNSANKATQFGAFTGRALQRTDIIQNAQKQQGYTPLK